MAEGRTPWIVGGIVALVLINRISRAFADSPAEQTAAEQAQQDQVLAGKFADPKAFPELWSLTPFTSAAASGAVSQDALNSTLSHTTLIAQSAIRYHGAKGVFLDDESEAVAAVALPNYWCLLVMAEAFASSYGETLGSYGMTFLETEHKAAICRIIVELRKAA